MKTTKHTPGPWIVTKTRPGVECVPGICSADGLHVTDVCGYGQKRAIDAANARLIAAAPELLTACQIALEYLDQQNRPRSIQDQIAFREHQREILCSAIAKATGQ